MINPLFEGFVAYVLLASKRKSEEPSLADFAVTFTELCSELRDHELIETAECYVSLLEYLHEHFSEKDINEQESHFIAIIKEHDTDSLMPAAVGIRNQLLMNALPPLSYRVNSIAATFTVYWGDGRQVEYTCRPSSLPNNTSMTVSFVDKLVKVYTAQFCETLLHPGLDSFHDQVATSFNSDKFLELVKVMHVHMNSKPASEREPYMNLIKRITHQFMSNLDNIKIMDDADVKPLERLSGSGGFKL